MIESNEANEILLLVLAGRALGKRALAAIDELERKWDDEAVPAEEPPVLSLSSGPQKPTPARSSPKRLCSDEEDIPGFGLVREAYPSVYKGGLNEARRMWRKHKLEDRSAEIVTAIRLYKKYHKKWQPDRNGDCYIPNLSTFLNQGYFEDLSFVPQMAPVDADTNPNWWHALMDGVSISESQRRDYLKLPFGSLPRWLQEDMLLSKFTAGNRA